MGGCLGVDPDPVDPDPVDPSGIPVLNLAGDDGWTTRPMPPHFFGTPTHPHLVRVRLLDIPSPGNEVFVDVLDKGR